MLFQRSKTGNKILLWIVLAAIVMFYFIFDPMTAVFMPKCVFHHLTGLQCIGCGSQRMLHALLHGEIAEAFHANALAFLSLPFLGFLGWLEIYREKHNKLYIRIYSVTFIWIVAAILISWLFIRNLLHI